MNNPIRTFCNEGCKKEFVITKMKTIKAKGGVDKTFFRCTHCKHQYIAYYSSAKTVKLQQEMKRLQKELPKLANRNKDATDEQWRKIVDAHWVKIHALKAKVKQSMDEAKLIAEG